MGSLRKKLSNNSERTRTIIKNIGYSSIYKTISILINFFLVPLSISYLGSEKYGLWLTIFSFIGWFSFFDFGIGNGLRNKLTVAISSNDVNLAKAYVSTAYFTIAFVILFLIALFLIIYSFIPWESLFNIQNNHESLRQLIVIVFVIFLINLVLKMINTIFYADQKPSIPGLMQTLGQIIVFISIYIAIKSTNSSLLTYGSIVIGGPSLVFLLTSVIAFSGKYSSIRPNLIFFEGKYAYEILSLGGRFFFIQIAAILIYSTDNFIINYFLGASEVTVYNVAFKYFMFVSMGMTIILEPFWSAFTDAQTKNDMQWIKKSIINLLKISTLASLTVIVMIFMANKVYLLWVGETIHVPFLLTIVMGINTILQVFMHPIIMFINGVGKIKIQLITGLIVAVINIPLSIILAVHFNLGITGVILATVITRMLEFFIYPIQVYKLINGTAKGIWNI